MVNLIKLIKHIKQVGWKEFRKEFSQNKDATLVDPLFALRLQLQGYMGMILFSLVATSVLFYQGYWYIACIFLFNILVTSGQLLTARANYKDFKMIRNQENNLTNLK